MSKFRAGVMTALVLSPAIPAVVSQAPAMARVCRVGIYNPHHRPVLGALNIVNYSIRVKDDNCHWPVRPAMQCLVMVGGGEFLWKEGPWLHKASAHDLSNASCGSAGENYTQWGFQVREPGHRKLVFHREGHQGIG